MPVFAGNVTGVINCAVYKICSYQLPKLFNESIGFQ